MALLPRQAPDEVAGLSASSMASLEEAGDRRVNFTTVATFSVSILAMWFLMYAFAAFTNEMLSRFTKTFRKLSFENRRTANIYVLNIVFTTAIFVIQMLCIPVLWKDYTSRELYLIEFISSLLSVLYLYELTYRSNMRIQMLLHHFCTLFSTSFVLIIFQESRDFSMITTGLLWIFQASTEQMIFVGLLMYRFRWSPNATILALKIGAVQAIIFKFASTCYIMVWWGLKQSRHHSKLEIVYSVVLVLANGLLALTQFYGSWIVWKIAIGYRQKYESERNRDRSGDGTPPIHLEEQDFDFRPLNLGHEETGSPIRASNLRYSGGSDNHPLLPSMAFESGPISIHSRRGSEISLGGGEWEKGRIKGEK